jgi:uncharacterized membrane protein
MIQIPRQNVAWIEHPHHPAQGKAMKAHAAAYFGAILVFATLDILWLSLAGAALFKRTLGGVLLEDIRVMPALLFYLVFPVGIVVFAISPALRANAPMMALGFGALLGFFAYATYDLTNFATIKGWTAQLTMIDIACGTTWSALAALAGYYVANWFN